MPFIDVPVWNQVSTPGRSVVSNFSFANPPSPGSLTILSTLTISGLSTPTGIVVTTKCLSDGTVTQARMLVNNTEINPQVMTLVGTTWRSVFTLTPFSDLSARVVEQVSIQTSGSTFTESSVRTVPWTSSINSIELEGFTFGNAATFTFESSNGTTRPNPVWEVYGSDFT